MTTRDEAIKLAKRVFCSPIHHSDRAPRARAVAAKRSLRFVERERLGSIAAMDDILAVASSAYRAACKHDEMPEDTVFAVFSDDNPFMPYIGRALDQYREMASNVAAHGYEGLRIGSKELYKRNTPARRAK